MKNLIDLLETPSHTGECEMMAAYIITRLNALGIDSWQDEEGNVYAAKGRGPYPCVVAHMDTVHQLEDKINAIILGDNITGMNEAMEQTGIGGDDKCGIFAALNAMEKLPHCKAAFFIDEECGCHGSRKSDLSFFADCRFVLQADRRGNADFVTDISGPLSSDSFLVDCAPILKSHGYKHSPGGMTDVMELRDREVGISVANISAGYYRPHCADEYIHVPSMRNAAALILAICQSLKGEYPFTFERPKFTRAIVKSYSYTEMLSQSTYGYDDCDPQGYWSAYVDQQEKDNAEVKKTLEYQDWKPANDQKARERADWEKREAQLIRDNAPPPYSRYVAGINKRGKGRGK